MSFKNSFHCWCCFVPAENGIFFPLLPLPLSFLGFGGGYYVSQADFQLLDPPASGTVITDVSSIPV